METAEREMDARTPRPDTASGPAAALKKRQEAVGGWVCMRSIMPKKQRQSKRHAGLDREKNHVAMWKCAYIQSAWSVYDFT
ncbi:MAG TPA: hypothetical protein DCW29_17050 [Janthinobacterium sp.]|nr:hypothetical protein [Janthinobacterium sp.]